MESNDEAKLMCLEKKRIGISKDKLVFIGMANLSKYYWCAWQYYLKSKKNELGFFLAYFEDRIEYSKELNLIRKVPKNKNKQLLIGDNINLDQIQKLLNKKETHCPSEDIKKKIKKKLINEKDSLQKGNYFQILHAENYPSIRWNFRFKDIVILGVPDGITQEFVYEFKYTSRKRFLPETLRTARLQADLYGYYFNRPKKRIQIYCEEEEKIYTYFEDIEKKEILELLNKWTKMINGDLPIKPQQWKCNICEFKDECVLLKS